MLVRQNCTHQASQTGMKADSASLSFVFISTTEELVLVGRCISLTVALGVSVFAGAQGPRRNGDLWRMEAAGADAPWIQRRAGPQWGSRTLRGQALGRSSGLSEAGEEARGDRELAAN